jgi:serine/threonine protein kinase
MASRGNNAAFFAIVVAVHSRDRGCQIVDDNGFCIDLYGAALRRRSLSSSHIHNCLVPFKRRNPIEYKNGKWRRGEPAFSGKSRASLIAAILTTEPPPITQLQPLTPLALQRVVKKCLAKDPDERWQSASDLASELKWMAEGGSQASVPAPVVSKPKNRERLGWTLAAIALSAAVVLAAIQFRGGVKPAPVVRSLIPMEEGAFPIMTGDFAGPPVVSPDGSVVAFVAARGQGAVLLLVRPLNALHARKTVVVQWSKRCR